MVESVANAAAQTRSIDTRTVSADYFTTMQIPLVGGQVFSTDDGPQAAPVVVVNESMVNRYWSNQDPLGKRIKIGNADSKSPWFVVQGVVKTRPRRRSIRRPGPKSISPSDRWPDAIAA